MAAIGTLAASIAHEIRNPLAAISGSIQMLRARSDPEHRFFLFLHYYDVHSDARTPVPYTSPYQERFMPDGVAWKHPG